MRVCVTSVSVSVSVKGGFKKKGRQTDKKKAKRESEERQQMRNEKQVWSTNRRGQRRAMRRDTENTERSGAGTKRGFFVGTVVCARPELLRRPGGNSNWPNEGAGCEVADRVRSREWVSWVEAAGERERERGTGRHTEREKKCTYTLTHTHPLTHTVHSSRGHQQSAHRGRTGADQAKRPAR